MRLSSLDLRLIFFLCM